jgi:glycosyltransferase involved in cell wall biosynthesis
MPPLRILVLTNRFPPDAEGGYEHSCSLVVAALRARGHQVVVVTRRGQTVQPERDIHRILFDRNSGNRSLLFAGWFMEPLDNKRFARLLKVVGADVAYIWGATGLSVRVIAMMTRSLPTVVYVADYWFADWLSGLRLPDGFAHQIHALATRQLVRSGFVNGAINRLFLLADTRLYRHRMAVSPLIVQFDSNYMASDILKRHVALGSSRILPHAIDVLKFPFVDPSRRKDINPRILFVGRVVPQKGVETLLHAVAMVRQHLPDVALTIVGPIESQYARSLQDLVTRLGLDGYVELLGKRAQDELRALYQSHTVLAFPSEWAEPFGIVLLEAMASGLPIVSSGAGGSGEIVTHGVNGLVFERGSRIDLANTLTTLVSSTDLRADLARRARRQVEAKYHIHTMVNEIENDLLAAVHAGSSTSD